jgi:hypothetical protein
MAKTHRAEVRAAVKEHGNGRFFLALEPAGEGKLPQLGNGGFGSDLRDSTTLDQARKLAQDINLHLASVSITTFGA